MLWDQRKVEAFVASRRRRPRRFDVPSALYPASVDEGYGVLLGVHRTLEASGDRRIGFKVACTTEATRKAAGAESPAYAGLFESDRFPSLEAAVSSQFGRTGYECEIAVRIVKNIDYRVVRWQDVLPFVDAVAVACEIVVDRYGDARAVGLPALVADDWFQAGYVIGQWIDMESAPTDLDKLRAVVTLDDGAPVNGWSWEVMGNPLASVSWLANALGEHHDALRAGDTVLTGAIVAPCWVESPPRSMKMWIDGLGEIGFQRAE